MKNQTQTPEFFQVYNGKDRHCRCGCAGTYHTSQTQIKAFHTLAENLLRSGEATKEENEIYVNGWRYGYVSPTTSLSNYNKTL